MRQIFLDTETTGLSAADGDRIIELGCIEFDNRRPTGRTLHHYVNPGRPSHPDAVRIHGITDEFLADKPPFATILDEVLDFLQGAELIAHNASFDVGFLDAEFARAGLPRTAELCGQITDSLALAREIYPGKANSLDSLCKRLEVDNTHRTFHGALMDAELLAEVYVRMTRGQGSLVGEEEGGEGSTVQLAAIDLSQFQLPVIEPAADEAEAHEKLLGDLDKACKGGAVWRKLQASETVA